MGKIDKSLLDIAGKCLTWGEILSLLTAVSGGIVALTTAPATQSLYNDMDLAAQVYSAINPEYKKDHEETMAKLGVDLQSSLISKEDYDSEVKKLSTTEAIINHLLANKNTNEKTKEDVDNLVKSYNEAKTAKTIGGLMIGTSMVTLGMAGIAKHGIVEKEKALLEESETTM